MGRPRRLRHDRIIALVLLLALGCSEAPDVERPYRVPLRSDAELEQALAALCRTATTEPARPALLEFSAEWCSDCLRLHAMKQQPALAKELANWPYLNVNVGRFDRHRALLAAMSVDSIAHWSILSPTDCEADVDRWPERARRTLEVSSGEARSLSPDDLARWLATHRER